VTDRAKLAVIGATGYVGRRLHRAALERDPSSVGTSRREDQLPTLDLRSPDIRELRLPERGHTHAAITAAVPEIAACERDPAGTRAVNVDGAVEVARQLQNEGVVPVLFSSDYVFDGEAGGYADAAPLSPTTEYGRQKAELEEAVGGRALVLRLGKVYGTERGEGTLLDEMAGSLAAGRPVRAAADQVMTPVLARDVVEATFALVDRDVRGVVNVCGSERCSRLALAQAIAEALGAEPSLVRQITLDELDEDFTRPKRTDLVAERLRAETDIRPVPVSEVIPRVAANYSEVRA
jgi:dTDP-4-dehydrorhamnose reductase